MKTLFLAWQDPKSRAWFPIGRLNFDGKKYQFVYTHGAVEAQSKYEFQPLLSFPDLNKVYTSSEIFPLFSNRLMQRSRPDYKNYIEWLNIPEGEDDQIAILARSGGRKATDNFEVFPCPEPDENGLYHIHFFAHGIRYLPNCAIERINQLKPGEILYLAHASCFKSGDPPNALAHEFQNPYDSSALLLCTEDHHIVGYCPQYIVDDVFLLKNKTSHVKVQVERVNPVPTPLQLRLLCNLTGEWHEEFRPFSSQEYQAIATDIPAPSVK